MPELHARLGPSNHRWPHCPGSPREEAKYPDIPGEAAIDGTGSHLLLEQSLLNGVNPDAYIGQIIGVNHHDNPLGWVVHQDRVDRVNMCLNYIRRRYKELGDEYPGCDIVLEAESKADPGGMFGRDDWWGTCDVTMTVFVDGRVVFLETIDYKDGVLWVEVDDNTQLYSYMLGKLRPYVASGPDLVRPFHPERVGSCRITIVQPKTSRPVRYKDLTTSEVVSKGLELERAADKTDDPNAPLIPDNKGGKGHCRWCKHRDYCDALAQTKHSKVEVMSDLICKTESLNMFSLIENVTKDIENVNSEKLAKLMDAKPTMDEVFKQVEKEIARRLKNGDKVPLYAMRPGKGSRVYAKSETEVAKKLQSWKWKKAEIYPPSLISPAQVLSSGKLTEDQKQKFEDEFIAFKAGTLKVTRVSDDYQEEKATPQELFGDVAGTSMFNDTPSFDKPQPSFDKPQQSEPPSFDKPNEVSFM